MPHEITALYVGFSDTDRGEAAARPLMTPQHGINAQGRF